MPCLGQEQEGNLRNYFLCFVSLIEFFTEMEIASIVFLDVVLAVLYLDFQGTTKKLGCNMHVPHVWHSRSDLYLGGGQDGHCFRVAKFSLEDVNNLTW